MSLYIHWKQIAYSILILSCVVHCTDAQGKNLITCEWMVWTSNSEISMHNHSHFEDTRIGTGNLVQLEYLLVYLPS